jgi:hypothetical protein
LLEIVMSRVEIPPKPNKIIAPRRVVTGLTVGLEQKSVDSSWIALGKTSLWYYRIQVNGETWQELATASRDQALSVLDEYGDNTQNITIRVRDKMLLYLDPIEAVNELDAMESP